jgi:tetratricopeptide (TPR) repeat protein
MKASEQYTRADLRRILDVSDKQLKRWEESQVIEPRVAAVREFYDFRDLIALRTAKQLMDKGVSPARLKHSLTALRQKLSEVKSPLTELRIISNGKDVIVEDADGGQLEPISGQFILNFATRDLLENVRVMPDRNADGWFRMALEFDADPATRAKAIESYERVIAIEPRHVEALLNRGALAFEDGQLEIARDFFARAVEVQPDNPLARFNLASTLDDLGLLQDARQQLRLAARLDPGNPDIRYNLATVCDKLGSPDEAREHWIAYLKLDPASSYADYARRRLNSGGDK